MVTASERFEFHDYFNATLTIPANASHAQKIKPFLPCESNKGFQ
jgi:hypothetical protein